MFSDEFEQDGRSFEDGSDPRWTAIDKNDCKLCAALIKTYFSFDIHKCIILIAELLVPAHRYKRSATLLQTRKRPNHKWRLEHNHHPTIQQIQSIRRRQTQILRRCQTHPIGYGTGLEQILYDGGYYRIQCKAAW